MTKTYTLAIALSDDVVLACVPDGGDIAGALQTVIKSQIYSEIGIVSGLVLAQQDQVQKTDACFHSFHALEFSPMRDVNGVRYRYAVERQGFPLKRQLLKRIAA